MSADLSEVAATVAAISDEDLGWSRRLALLIAHGDAPRAVDFWHLLGVALLEEEERRAAVLAAIEDDIDDMTDGALAGDWVVPPGWVVEVDDVSDPGGYDDA